MPKEIKDVREFISRLWKPGVKYVSVHKKVISVNGPFAGHKGISGGTKHITKFKLRCSRYLYTLTVDNRDKALKLANSLPARKKQYVKPLYPLWFSDLVRHTNKKTKK